MSAPITSDVIYQSVAGREDELQPLLNQLTHLRDIASVLLRQPRSLAAFAPEDEFVANDLGNLHTWLRRTDALGGTLAEQLDLLWPGFIFAEHLTGAPTWCAVGKQPYRLWVHQQPRWRWWRRRQLQQQIRKLARAVRNTAAQIETVMGPQPAPWLDQKPIGT